ncbi:unnamed protein product [Cercospora beticola]|nr:unnamed protein product [Cercospora beticola]
MENHQVTQLCESALTAKGNSLGSSSDTSEKEPASTASTVFLYVPFMAFAVTVSKRYLLIEPSQVPHPNAFWHITIDEMSPGPEFEQLLFCWTLRSGSPAHPAFAY